MGREGVGVGCVDEIKLLHCNDVFTIMLGLQDLDESSELRVS